MIRYTLIGLLYLATMLSAQAELRYDLQAIKVATDTYVVEGRLEDFSVRNGGNIVNTSFIITEQGVAVFDTGPSYRYGKELRALIATLTKRPVTHVFNSHHHPDHFLGNQAFQDSTIYALDKTGQQMANQGEAFSGNMYSLVGDWMRGTEVYLPNKPIDFKFLNLGKHQLYFYTFTGHTGSDLVILDKSTGVLFAGDLVFHKRALTTPHTPGLNIWIEELEQLNSLPFDKLIPGHGPINDDKTAIKEDINYLRWLDKKLSHAAENGLTMSEVMSSVTTDDFTDMKLLKSEFSRSVMHLYANYEELFFD